MSEKSSYNRSSPSSDNSFNPMVGLDIDDPETFQVLPCMESSKGKLIYGTLLEPGFIPQKMMFINNSVLSFLKNRN